MFLIRVPHTSGMLEGNIPPKRYSLPGALIGAIVRAHGFSLRQKVEQLRFWKAGRGERSAGGHSLATRGSSGRLRAAEYLQFCAASRISPTRRISLPLTADEMDHVASLVSGTSDCRPRKAKFKGDNGIERGTCDNVRRFARYVLKRSRLRGAGDTGLNQLARRSS